MSVDNGQKATIWHNPRCSKSRAALGLLTDAGAEVTVVEYLKAPPDRAELERVLARGGLRPRDLLRAGEPRARALGLAEADDAAVLDALVANPELIERPLVETGRGVRMGRPPEHVLELLD